MAKRNKYTEMCTAQESSDCISRGIPKAFVNAGTGYLVSFPRNMVLCESCYQLWYERYGDKSHRIVEDPRMSFPGF